MASEAIKGIYTVRIVYISYMHPSVAPGGAQQVAYEMFEASLISGDDAYLIAALEAHHDDQYGKPGAPIVPVHGESRQFFFFPQAYVYNHVSILDWRSLQFLGNLVAKLRPDVVHFHHYHRIGVESIKAIRNAVPSAVIALTFHEMMAICLADGQMVRKHNRELCGAARPIDCNKCFPSLRPEFFTLRAERLKLMLGECDCFIFPSEFLAQRYMQWGLPLGKCAVIPNGQKDRGEGFDRAAHSSLVNRFGFFGQFVDNKGVDLVLQALIMLLRERSVPSCGVIFEINGGNLHYASDSYLSKIEQLLNELKAVNNGLVAVVNRGQYSHDDLQDRMSAVDWVIVPSTWWEVFGLVVSEAWMFGRPVIAADIGGVAERVVEGVNGLKFSPRDCRGLADLIRSVCGRESRWKEINVGVARPWSGVEMLNAHKQFWCEMSRSQKIAVESVEVNGATLRFSEES